MSARFRVPSIAAAFTLVLSLALVSLSAQGGGRPPGGGGSVGGMVSFTRLGQLTTTFKLDETQKKTAKAILDDAYKAAATVRASLTTARQKLGAAIQAGDQAPIDQATAGYAEQATAMAKTEADAIAKIVKALKPEQAPAPAVQTAMSLMRGAFVGKKWDTAPDVRFY